MNIIIELFYCKLKPPTCPDFMTQNNPGSFLPGLSCGSNGREDHLFVILILLLDCILTLEEINFCFNDFRQMEFA